MKLNFFENVQESTLFCLKCVLLYTSYIKWIGMATPFNWLNDIRCTAVEA